jgi:hypothetical protein
MSARRGIDAGRRFVGLVGLEQDAPRVLQVAGAGIGGPSPDAWCV